MDKTAVALYLRLSNEDSDKGKLEESNSISAQRVLLTKHVEELMQGQAYSITEFCDDGYSGTDFNRPGVQALIDAAKNGSVGMIVVKDFSRFGRDYLEVGRFLEYIFPILQVRFVSVNDNYDSSDKFGTTGGMSVALKNLVYGMYSADLSKKIRSARDTRVRNGEFVGQFAPYGYMKNPEDKHELLIDENVAWVVRRIFRQAADGVSHTEIARQLNEEGIPTRYMYHQLKGDNFPDKQPHFRVFPPCHFLCTVSSLCFKNCFPVILLSLFADASCLYQRFCHSPYLTQDCILKFFPHHVNPLTVIFYLLCATSAIIFVVFPISKFQPLSTVTTDKKEIFLSCCPATHITPDNIIIRFLKKFS